MLEVTSLAKTYGRGAEAVTALGDIGFSTRPGEFLSIIGPSGCGKTTLLQCISGLLAPTSGRVAFAGLPVTAPPDELAIVFQDYSRSLFPWMSVLGNVEAALFARGIGAAERRGRALDTLAAVGLNTDMTRLYPSQLSGGMQQRVAIARALVTSPTLLVMDEPFASVDAQMRLQLEDLLLSLWTRHGATIVFVTHDIDEAVYMSDRVLVLSPRPTRVLRQIDVDLPRPRHQISTRAASGYVDARTEVLATMMDSWSAAP